MVYDWNQNGDNAGSVFTQSVRRDVGRELQIAYRLHYGVFCIDIYAAAVEHPRNGADADVGVFSYVLDRYRHLRFLPFCLF